ncbi:hypothetical protein I7G59_19845 [Sinorhizobium meliloti]|uniref:hypothetical protein n=1 Tax=Rhizobium meliloti TaxID=382 RepID=UPI002380AFCF|nr:hypothetical protein [Sinorhizobium meliloti]MDE3799559.1 hypothetical protein [Sinorhizobium meliloti]
MTLVLDAGEAKFFNDTVQVYSKEAVFYVNERPEIINAFEAREHRQYDYNNSIDRLIAMIP